LPAQFRRPRRRFLYPFLDLAIAAFFFALLVFPRAGLYGVARSRRSIPHRASTARIQNFPQTFVWAWERPEDLTFIDARNTGVAYLAETIFVSNLPVQSNAATSAVAIRPRMQPLRLPDGAALMAVARIEMRGELPPEKNAGAQPDPRIEEVAAAIARLSEIPGIKAVQVDFDATLSQRAFYSATLAKLRQFLPAEMPLSITALASWCYGDPWINSLPIDEAVPMLFRMGVDDRNIRLKLADGEDFHSPVCGESLGFSTDERVPVVSPSMLSGRRIYWFHPRPWTAAAFHSAAEGVHP
jgi:hypothetical protein